MTLFGSHKSDHCCVCNLEININVPDEFTVCIFNIFLGSKGSLHMAAFTYSITFAGINVIPQYIHCLYLGRFYVRLKSICMSSGLLQYYQPTYLYIVYLGRFYVRSEVTHKSPPDYCVGKSVLHGEILREVRGHT